jgi:hypothetical protein
MNEERKRQDPDVRTDFIGVQVLKSFRLKPDKWQKLMASDDQVTKIFINFLVIFHLRNE